MGFNSVVLKAGENFSTHCLGLILNEDLKAHIYNIIDLLKSILEIEGMLKVIVLENDPGNLEVQTRVFCILIHLWYYLVKLVFIQEGKSTCLLRRKCTNHIQFPWPMNNSLVNRVKLKVNCQAGPGFNCQCLYLLSGWPCTYCLLFVSLSVFTFKMSIINRTYFFELWGWNETVHVGMNRTRCVEHWK